LFYLFSYNLEAEFFHRLDGVESYEGGAYVSPDASAWGLTLPCIAVRLLCDSFYFIFKRRN